MEQNTGVSGYDLACQIEWIMKLAVRQAMIAHTARKGCEWKPGAFEEIIKSPTFRATVDAVRDMPTFVELGKLLEFYERCKEAA